GRRLAARERVEAMTRATLVAIATIASALGCGSVNTYRWPLGPAAAGASPGVEVYFEGTMPATGMEELELVEAIGVGTKSNVEDVVEAMRAEALRYGASALVRVRVDCGHGECHGYGVAVRYVTAPPR